MPLHLGLDHVAGAGSRHVRAEDQSHVVGGTKALQQRGEPALVRRRGVLGQKGHVLATRQPHRHVALVISELLIGRRADERIHLAAPNKSVRQVFDISGLSLHFEIFPTVEAALEAVSLSARPPVERGAEG